MIVRRGPADFGPTAAAVFRRADFDRVGGIRGDLVFSICVDLFARVATSGCFYGMLERTAAWRSSSYDLCATSSSLRSGGLMSGWRPSRPGVVPQGRCHPACSDDDVETIMTAAVPRAVVGAWATTRTSGPSALAVPGAVPRG